MIRIVSFILFISPVLPSVSFCQPGNAGGIDDELTGIYKQLVAGSRGTDGDSLAGLFKRRLLLRLRRTVSFAHPFDSLSRHITIRTSADKKLRFYSWDDLRGGSWHNFNCIAQFKSSSGKIIVQSISTGNEGLDGSFTDSEIYEVHQLTHAKSRYYLSFAYGTHGSGRQYQLIQIFTISDNKLLPCKSCIDSKDNLVIEYPRTDKSNLRFNPATNTISFNEFKLDEDTGFYQPTGSKVILKWEKGKFSR